MKNNFLVKYLRDSWFELGKVTWPTQKEVLNHTIVVIISITVATGVTALIDWGLSYLVQYLVENRG